MKKITEELKKERIEFALNTDAGQYTTMKIKATVYLLIIAETREHLIKAVSLCAKHRAKFVVLGGGSNTVFSTNQKDLIVILNRYSGVKRLNQDIISISSGTGINKLLGWAVKNQAGGLEFLAGIPGTTGGSAVVNAGAYGREFSEIFINADYIDCKGVPGTISREEMNYSYRTSSLKSRQTAILTDIRVKTYPESDSEIRKKIKTYYTQRMDNHPAKNALSAGCFFKNPVINGKKTSAGKIIEDSGLKGFKTDNLTVSAKHCNFIINNGRADIYELEALCSLIRRTVLKKNKISLEREVVFISSEGKKY